MLRSIRSSLKTVPNYGGPQVHEQLASRVPLTAQSMADRSPFGVLQGPEFRSGICSGYQSETDGNNFFDYSIAVTGIPSFRPAIARNIRISTVVAMV